MRTGNPKLVICDVDDVIINTDAAVKLAYQTLIQTLSSQLGDALAEKVGHSMNAHYTTLLQQLRSQSTQAPPEHTQLYARISKWQADVLAAGYDVKQWSRECLLAIALEDHNVEVTESMIHEVSTAFWDAVQTNSTLFADTCEWMIAGRAVGVHFHLASNSDGFLHLDTKRRSFVYDPEYSRVRKIARMAVLDKLEIAPEHVTVGDPFGKPNAAFYQQVLEDVRRSFGPVQPSDMSCVGDSLQHDVLPYLQLGIPRGLWLRRRASQTGVMADQPQVRMINAMTECLPWFGPCLP